MTEKLQEYFHNVPEWSDDRRMRGLFAKLPSKEDDRQLFDSKLRFWTEAIAESMKYVKDVVRMGITVG